MLRFSKQTQTLSSWESRKEGSLETIPIDRIKPNPYQPRKVFHDDALIELANSIKEYGLVQPINVRQSGNYYEIIAGERRYRACKLLGWTEIRAIVMYTAIDQDSAMIAMIENLQRENLHFFEEAEGYQSLIREHGFTQEELARKLSKNQSTIANKLRILRLPRAVKNKIVTKGLTERHARALLRLHNEDAELRLIDSIADGGLSVKATEKLVESELRKLYGEEPEEKQNIVRLMNNYRIYINTIKQAVKKIENFGASAQLSWEEKEDGVDIHIHLEK